MKKMKFISVAAAMFAACAMLSSCWGGSNEPVDPSNPKGSEVTAVSDETYSIIAASNEEVTFSIDVTASTNVAAGNKKATFSKIATTNTVVKVTATLINPAGFVTPSQVAIVKLSSATPSANISFDFAKKSTDTKTQAEITASASPVTITSNLSDLAASMTIQGGTTATAAGDFSVTAYKVTPETVPADAITVGTSIDTKVMVLDCTPNGATFDKDVTLTVYVGTELAGETVTIKNGADTETAIVSSTGYAQFTVSHFSLWDLLFAPVVRDVQRGSITLLNVVNYQVVAGVNTYNYTKNVGTKFATTAGLIGLYISKIFGNTEEQLLEEGSFQATEAGTATINVIQNYSDYVFGFGSKSFTVRVWDGTETTVTIAGGNSSSNSHSGGSGN